MRLTNALFACAACIAFVPSLSAQQVVIGDSTQVYSSAPVDSFSFAQLRYDADPAKPGEGKDANKKDEKPPRVFHYSIRLGGRFVYSDNITFAPEPDAIDDFYVSLEPGISVGLGDVPERKGNYVRLDYSPSALLYFDNSDLNTVNHFIHLEAVVHFGKLTLSLFQDVNLFEGMEGNFDRPNNNFGGNPSNPGNPGDNRNFDPRRGNRDVTGRNEIETYSTSAIARYDFTDKLSATGALRYNYTEFVGIFSTEFYGGDLFVDYKVTPELTFAVGGAGGVVYQDDPTIDEEFQEVRGRLNYDLPKRININGSLGVEFRQFGRGGSLGYTAPIVEANVSVEPIEGTRLTVGGRHRTLVSNALEGQSFTITGVNVGLRQKITDRIDFNVNSGYEQANYFSVFADVDAMRVDEFFFVEPSIDVKITDKWTVGAFYIHRENQTNLLPFGFAENQTGLRTGITF